MFYDSDRIMWNTAIEDILKVLRSIPIFKIEWDGLMASADLTTYSVPQIIWNIFDNLFTFAKAVLSILSMRFSLDFNIPVLDLPIENLNLSLTLFEIIFSGGIAIIIIIYVAYYLLEFIELIIDLLDLFIPT